MDLTDDLLRDYQRRSVGVKVIVFTIGVQNSALRTVYTSVPSRSLFREPIK